MNKQELISALASVTGLSKIDSSKAVDGFIEVVATTLQKGDEVKISGFGTFVVSHREASEGRNPRTGEKIKIPASKHPKFKAMKGLKDAVAKSKAKR